MHAPSTYEGYVTLWMIHIDDRVYSKVTNPSTLSKIHSICERVRDTWLGSINLEC